MITTLTLTTGPLIEEFPIALPDGRRWHGALYRHAGPHARRSGRRIVVRDQPGGAVLFDTDESYDFANAHNRLELWLRSQITPTE